MSVLTPEVAATMPPGALSGVLITLEGFGRALASLDDYELAYHQLNEGVQDAIHVLDAEQRRRV